MAETIRDPVSTREIASMGIDLESLFNLMLDDVLDTIDDTKNPEDLIADIGNVISD